MNLEDAESASAIDALVMADLGDAAVGDKEGVKMLARICVLSFEGAERIVEGRIGEGSSRRMRRYIDRICV